MNFQNNDELFNALQGTGLQREAAFRQLYSDGKLQGAIRQQLLPMGGDANDVQEMLSEALIELDQQLALGKYDPAVSKITTYLVAIARQKFFTRRRSEQRSAARHQQLAAQQPLEQSVDPNTALQRQHQKNILARLLDATGEKCREALRLYSFDYSYLEIADLLSYKNDQVAKMAVYDCRKRLRKILAEQPELAAQLLEP